MKALPQRFITLRALAASAFCVCAALTGCAPPIDRGPVPFDMPIAERIERAHQYADAAQREDNTERAIALYQRALNYTSEFGAAWNNLGVLLLERERVLEADEAFATAAELDQLDPRPVFNQGMIRQQRGKLAEARRYYAEALTRDPSFLPALRSHIQTESMQRLGDESTVERIDRALELERDETAIRTLKLYRLRLKNELDGEEPL